MQMVFSFPITLVLITIEMRGDEEAGGGIMAVDGEIVFAVLAVGSCPAG